MSVWLWIAVIAAAALALFGLGVAVGKYLKSQRFVDQIMDRELARPNVPRPWRAQR